jgi:tetratricopeptide (TPR) repeat protein
MGNIYSVAEFTNDRFEKALKEYDKALKLRPNFTAALVDRGVTRFIQNENAFRVSSLSGRFPEESENIANQIILDFDKALQINPELFSAYFNKGVVLKSMGKEREAIKCFDAAITIGLVHRQLHNPTIAYEGDYESLGTGHPMCTMSQFREYLIQKHLTIAAEGRSIVRLSTLITFIPGDQDPVAFAHYHKGVAYARSNVRDYKSAVQSLSQAIKLNPNVPEFYSKRALAYMGMGDAENMTADMSKAQELAKYFLQAAESK